jgi:hypothetical protein
MPPRRGLSAPPGYAAAEKLPRPVRPYRSRLSSLFQLVRGVERRGSPGGAGDGRHLSRAPRRHRPRSLDHRASPGRDCVRPQAQGAGVAHSRRGRARRHTRVPEATRRPARCQRQPRRSRRCFERLLEATQGADLNFTPNQQRRRHTTMQCRVPLSKCRSNFAGKTAALGSHSPAPAGEKFRTVQSTEASLPRTILPAIRAICRGRIRRSPPACRRMGIRSRQGRPRSRSLSGRCGGGGSGPRLMIKNSSNPRLAADRILGKYVFDMARRTGASKNL